ncbi:unnamed protein product [Symbiodinium pilosum]|uniref:Uncharacterized protein n=1 Tax=Symbiodinium pilosum TaxID=2952 RepID=A0A812NS29_SYMPI|nr:unnamed protein product [Symbiodinium pilosum]
MLCDLSDGPRRESDLNDLWISYRDWCNSQGVPDRAVRKLFASATLKPSSREYITISQKQLTASAARYFIFWLAQLSRFLLDSNPNNPFYQLLC